MFEFFIGVAVGAAFAPFWMGVWRTIKAMLPANKADK